MEKQRMTKDWIPLLGGLTALVGFFLPFDRARSLFHILENDPLPFFSPMLVLLLVLALLLRWRCPSVSLLLSQGLLSGLLFLFCILLWVFSLPVLASGLEIGGLLLPLGLSVMVFCPA